jgi:hypothetical protein
MNARNCDPRADSQSRLALFRTIISIALLSFLSMIFVNFIARSLDKEEIRGTIEMAFIKGDLIEHSYSSQDLRRGVNQFNDCLILQATLLDQQNFLADNISATVLADEVPCVTLHELVRGHSFDPQRLYSYSRYLWGARALSAIWLRFASLGSLRAIVETAVYVLLVCSLILAVFGYRARRIMSNDQKLFNYTVAVYSGVYLAFSSLQYFAPNIGHGFSELIIALFLAAQLLRGQRRTLSVRVLDLSLFGAWTAYFELLTGPLVVGIVLTGILAIFQNDEDTTWSTPRRMWIHMGIFALAFFAVMFAQQIAAYLVLGGVSLNDFWIHLAIRLQLHHLLGLSVPPLWQTETNMATYGPADVVRSIWDSMPMLTFGSRPLAIAVTVASVAMIVSGTVLASRAKTPSVRTQLTSVLMLLPIVPAWYLVFINHTVIHSFGAVRMMCMPIALSAIVFLLGFHALLGNEGK